MHKVIYVNFDPNHYLLPYVYVGCACGKCSIGTVFNADSSMPYLHVVTNTISTSGAGSYNLFACWVIVHASVVICRLFFKIYFFKEFFQEHCQNIKQFGSRSGSKLFDILIVFLKEFFEKVPVAVYCLNKISVYHRHPRSKERVC